MNGKSPSMDSSFMEDSTHVQQQERPTRRVAWIEVVLRVLANFLLLQRTASFREVTK